jgi:hypothetical protein
MHAAKGEENGRLFPGHALVMQVWPCSQWVLCVVCVLIAADVDEIGRQTLQRPCQFWKYVLIKV